MFGRLVNANGNSYFSFEGCAWDQSYSIAGKDGINAPISTSDPADMALNFVVSWPKN